MKIIKVKNLIHLTILIFLSNYLVGCSSLSSESDQNYEALAGDPDAMWAQGQKNITKGESLVAKGEELISEGRLMVRAGEVKINQGNIAVLQSREKYQEAARSSGRSSTPKELESEVKALKAIGNSWEDAIDEIRSGNDQVNKGNKNIEKGQIEISKGRTLIESGSLYMRNSQRMKRGEDTLSFPQN